MEVENVVVGWTVVLGCGMVAVVVTTVLVAVVDAALALVELLEVVVCVWEVRPLSGGTGTIVPRCVTETVAEVAASLVASDPAVAC